MSKTTDVMEDLYAHLDETADAFEIPIVVRRAAEFVVRDREDVRRYVREVYGVEIPESELATPAR